jgi:hypothetical protein
VQDDSSVVVTEVGFTAEPVGALCRWQLLGAGVSNSPGMLGISTHESPAGIADRAFV